MSDPFDKSMTNARLANVLVYMVPEWLKLVEYERKISEAAEKIEHERLKSDRTKE